MDTSVKFDGLRLRLREVREARLRLRFRCGASRAATDFSTGRDDGDE